MLYLLRKSNTIVLMYVNLFFINTIKASIIDSRKTIKYWQSASNCHLEFNLNMLSQGIWMKIWIWIFLNLHVGGNLSTLRKPTPTWWPCDLWSHMQHSVPNPGCSGKRKHLTTVQVGQPFDFNWMWAIRQINQLKRVI